VVEEQCQCQIQEYDIGEHLVPLDARHSSSSAAVDAADDDVNYPHHRCRTVSSHPRLVSVLKVFFVCSTDT